MRPGRRAERTRASKAGIPTNEVQGGPSAFELLLAPPASPSQQPTTPSETPPATIARGASERGSASLKMTAVAQSAGSAASSSVEESKVAISKTEIPKLEVSSPKSSAIVVFSKQSGKAVTSETGASETGASETGANETGANETATRAATNRLTTNEETTNKSLPVEAIGVTDLPAVNDATVEPHVAVTPVQIELDPKPLPVPIHQDPAAHQNQQILGEQSSEVAIQELPTAATKATASLSAQFANAAAPRSTLHPSTIVLKELVSHKQSVDAASTSVAVQEEEIAAKARVVPSTEARPGQTVSPHELLVTETTSPPNVPVELRQLLAKDFARLTHHVESLSKRFGQTDTQASPQPNFAASPHTDLTALATHRRIADQAIPVEAAADHTSLPPHQDSASPAALFAVAIPTAITHKSIFDGTTAVSEQLSAAVLKQFDQEPVSASRTFRMRLDPRELGPVEVQLTVVNEVISIRFVADNEAARQVISRQLDVLRHSLTNSGISFGQFDVSSNGGGGHGSPHTRDDQQHSLSRLSSRVAWSPKLGALESSDDRYTGRLNFVA